MYNKNLDILEALRRQIKVNYQDFQEKPYEKDVITFITRENGNTLDEEPGEVDIANANKFKDFVKSKYPNVTVDVDTIDEWTQITCFING